jgi:hypothetical protein
LRAISEREYHLSRLHALLLSAIGPVPVDPVDLPAYATLLSTVRSASAQELQALRLASVDVVEAIVRWRRRRRRPFEPFVWRSHNYLLKMLLDVFFLGLASTVDDAAADPFLLRSFAEALEHGRRMEADTAALLHEQTAVRMDLSHSGWSDIFFLGMDYPDGARVLNVSIDLGVHGRDAAPKPPVEAYLRVIDSPVLRLTSVDLATTAEITDLGEVFDFARDYLGLLKAAVIAAGITLT